VRRSTLDRLVSYVGLTLATILLVAGGLMTWASTFVGNQVSDQLTSQKITMPSGQAIENPDIKPYLEKYSGQEMSTGEQAEAFANHYILVHLNAAGGGKTYEEISGEYLTMSKDTTADPAALKKLGDVRETLFMGNALRGMLLNAYAFGTMATILGIAAIVAFVGAAVLLVLALLGLRHATTAASGGPNASGTAAA